MRIEASYWRGSDVPDVVCAGAARAHAERLNAIEDADNISGLKLTDLKIAASGEIDAAGTPVFGHLGKPAKLVSREDAARNSKAEHEGVLRGGDVKEAEVLEAETIVLGGRLVLIGVLKKLFPNGEGALLELPTLFLGEIGDRSVEPQWFGFDGFVGQA